MFEAEMSPLTSFPFIAFIVMLSTRLPLQNYSWLPSECCHLAKSIAVVIFQFFE